MADFHRLRLRPTERLTPGQAARLKFVRERIAPIEADTIMQRAMPPEDAAKYFSGDWQTVRGFAARGQDVAMLRTRAAIIEGKALLYRDNPYAGKDVLYLIRFRARSLNHYQIPYGGNNPQGVARMGGRITNLPPFTGNGFTASKQRTVPELRIQSRVPLTESAELYRIEGNRPEVLVGLFHEDAKRSLKSFPWSEVKNR